MLYAQVVPGHQAALMSEVAGDYSVYFLVHQPLLLQFFAQLLSIVRPEPVGAAILVAERPTGRDTPPAPCLSEGRPPSRFIERGDASPR
jgi:hypothetical protein